MEEVTAIIHTFRRPDCQSQLLESIKKYYPEIKVIVHDDSENDRGVSWGRNYLVSQVQTKYYLILDDDFVFTENTRIELLLEKIKDYDIVAGALEENEEVRHYEGRLNLEDGILKRTMVSEEPLDFVFQFFLAKKEVTGWNEEIKIGEHTAFFWEHKGQWKIGYEPRCVVEHHPVKDEEYKKYRDRVVGYINLWMTKNNIKKIE